MKTLIFFTYLINKCSIIVKTISYSFHNSLFLKFSLVPINIPFSREDMGGEGARPFPRYVGPLSKYISYGHPWLLLTWTWVMFQRVMDKLLTPELRNHIYTLMSTPEFEDMTTQLNQLSVPVSEITDLLEEQIVDFFDLDSKEDNDEGEE